MESKKFLTAEEVAAEFGLDATALQAFVDSGEVRALADRGTWKYRRDELQSLVEAGKIEASLSDGDQVLTFDNSEDDISYIELDETALAEQATMITKSSDVPETPVQDDWFVPAAPVEMDSPVEQTSSDVAIYSGPEKKSTGEAPVLAEGSDSDVQIAPDYHAPAAEESDETVWDDLAVEETGSHETDSSVRLADDSGVQLTGLASSGLRLPIEDSGIMLDEGSQIGLPGGSSLIAEDVHADSGLALDVGAPDSGIAIDTGAHDSGIALDTGKPDSGITLHSGDSGLALDTGKPDSGISLSAGDSGISLGGPDSGLSLESAGDSSLAFAGSGVFAGNAKTLADMNTADGDDDRTQTLNLMGDDDDSSLDINLDDGDATAELLLGDEDDVDDATATIVRKGGRPAPGGLSEAFELDDDAEVEDLEISEDLDAGSEAEVEEFEAEEEVFDASDETFSGDEVEATGEEEDEDYLEPAAKSKKAAGPKEPAWGAGMAVGLVACTLFLAANSVILWTGVSTMWSGADSEGPGGSLIQTLGDLIK